MTRRIVAIFIAAAVALPLARPAEGAAITIENFAFDLKFPQLQTNVFGFGGPTARFEVVNPPVVEGDADARVNPFIADGSPTFRRRVVPNDPTNPNDPDKRVQGEVRMPGGGRFGQFAITGNTGADSPTVPGTDNGEVKELWAQGVMSARLGNFSANAIEVKFSGSYMFDLLAQVNQELGVLDYGVTQVDISITAGGLRPPAWNHVHEFQEAFFDGQNLVIPGGNRHVAKAFDFTVTLPPDTVLPLLVQIGLQGRAKTQLLPQPPGPPPFVGPLEELDDLPDPIPEPVSLVVLGFGLATVLCRKRHWRGRQQP